MMIQLLPPGCFMQCFMFAVCIVLGCPTIRSPPPHHAKKRENTWIWILCQNPLTRELKIRVVEFVLQQLFTHGRFVWKCRLYQIHNIVQVVSVMVLPPLLHPHAQKQYFMDLDSLSKFNYQRAHIKSCMACALEVIHS